MPNDTASKLRRLIDDFDKISDQGKILDYQITLRASIVLFHLYVEHFLNLILLEYYQKNPLEAKKWQFTPHVLENLPFCKNKFCMYKEPIKKRARMMSFLPGTQATLPSRTG